MPILGDEPSGRFGSEEENNHADDARGYLDEGRGAPGPGSGYELDLSSCQHSVNIKEQVRFTR
jgi:hypothetical protein